MRQLLTRGDISHEIDHNNYNGSKHTHSLSLLKWYIVLTWSNWQISPERAPKNDDNSAKCSASENFKFASQISPYLSHAYKLRTPETPWIQSLTDCMPHLPAKLTAEPIPTLCMRPSLSTCNRKTMHIEYQNLLITCVNMHNTYTTHEPPQQVTPCVGVVNDLHTN